MTAKPFEPIDIPFLTTDEMREVDRLMMEEYGITLFQMMEDPGRALARFGRDRFLDGDAKGKRVHVLVGPGATVAVAWSARATSTTGTPSYIFSPRSEATPGAKYPLANCTSSTGSGSRSLLFQARPTCPKPICWSTR